MVKYSMNGTPYVEPPKTVTELLRMYKRKKLRVAAR